MAKGGGGGSTTINPYQAAQADWLFNRQNQYTPYGQVINTFPGQSAPTAPSVNFLNGGLSQDAMGLFGPQPTPGSGGKGGKGGTGGKGTVPTPQNPTTGTNGASGDTTFGNINGGKGQVSAGPTAQSVNTANPTTARTPTSTSVPGRGGGKGGKGGVFPDGRPTSPATVTQIMDPQLLALESGKATAQANSLAEALKRQQAMAGGSLPSLVNGLSGSGLPGLPSDPAQFENRTIQSMFQLGSEPLNRQYGRQFDMLEQSLANKGLAYPGEAASRQMSDLFREQAQGMQNLALQSVLAGGQEASRSINDILGIRGQSVGEQMSNANLASNSRMQQFNELNTLLGLSPVGGAPQAQSNPIDLMGAFGLQQQGKIANQQIRQQNAASTNASLVGLIGALAPLFGSDRRMKKNIFKVGQANNINLYAFEYLDGTPSVGVMADEVPWAAYDVEGMKYVNYAEVF